MLNPLKTATKKLRILNTLIEERELADREVPNSQQNVPEATQLFVPPGHFYSPIPSMEEIKKDEAKIFDSMQSTIHGVELHEAEQLELLKKFVPFYNQMSFSENKQEGLRYYFENPAYSYSDAIMLHCMMRLLQPNRIIEVGSGFSSCMMLDTNELHFDQEIEMTFIEPYPDLLLSLIKEKDNRNICTIQSRLQDVNIAEFDKLQANDILFIDSTHVSKTNSDVNHLFFNILPRLKAGVYIHFHDIFFPFEYPKEWVYEGRAWNEVYILRAFLQFNTAFKIVLMNTFIANAHQDFLSENMPLCLKNTGGSIWLSKDKVIV